MIPFFIVLVLTCKARSWGWLGRWDFPLLVTLMYWYINWGVRMQ